jgi:hypothetical protein
VEDPSVDVKRGSGRLRRVLLRIAIVIGVLVVLAVVLFEYGSMWPPSAEVQKAYADGVRAGVVPAIEQPFHIPIPGCVCHSTDPVVQMQHAALHISECSRSGCHGS